MPTLQEIADKLEIMDLPTAYANAIDSGNWDALDDVFTPDAYIDYRQMGGPDGKYPAIKEYLRTRLPDFPNYMHLVGNVTVKVTGDTATGRTACFNPMEMELKDGSRQVFFCGLWYADKYVRTPKGWRFSERVEEQCYFHNVPAELTAQIERDKEAGSKS